MSKDAEEFRENSQAVQAHLSIMQSVIQRMAANSSSSKAWCITLVSAMLVLLAENKKPDLVLLALFPTLLFVVLDAYYLALEREFRGSYNEFIKKLHAGRIRAEDLFVVEPKGSIYKDTFFSLFSFSVWPFYVVMVAACYLTKSIVQLGA